MTEDRHSDEGDQDAELARLLAQVRAHDDDADRPDDATIDAYVLGRADQRQLRRMHAALARSTSLRQEVHALAHAVGAIDADPDATAALDPDVPAPPDRQEFLRRYGASTERRRRFAMRLVIALAAAVALVILVGRVDHWSGRGADAHRTWHIETQRVDAGLLLPAEAVAGDQRTEARHAYASADSAALAACRDIIRVDAQGELVVVGGTEKAATASLALAVVDMRGQTRVADLPPPPATSGARDAWLLVLPQRTLYRANANAQPLRFPWPVDAHSAAAVLTARAHEGYVAGPAVGIVP